MAKVTRTIIKDIYIRDLNQAIDRLIEAVKEGFDFKINCLDDKQINLRYITGLAAWLCEERKNLPYSYESTTIHAMDSLYTQLKEDLEKTIIKKGPKNRDPLGNALDFIHTVFTDFDFTDAALMYTMFSMRFKFPLQNIAYLTEIIYYSMETVAISKGCKHLISARIAELFTEKTVKCVHEFVSRCLEGESWKKAQSSLSSGAFKIMLLEDGKTRHLSIRGRQCMRLIASILYCVYVQNSALNCGLDFKSIDLKDIITVTGIGRVDWLMNFLTKAQDYSTLDNIEYIGLCCLDCEPQTITIKLSDKKLAEVGTYRSIAKLTASMYNSVFAICNYVLEARIHKNEVENKGKEHSEELKKERSEHSEALRSLNNELADKKRTVRDLTKQITKLSEDCSSLVNENVSLSAEVRKAMDTDVVKEKETEITNLQNLIKDLKAELSSTKDKNASLQNRVVELEERKVKAQDNEDELRKLRKRVFELEELNSELESELFEEAVSLDEIADFCRKIKPCVVTGLKNFDKVCSKIFEDFIFKDADDDDVTNLPSNVDCFLMYTRKISHAAARSLQANSNGVPVIYIKNTNPDLIRKEVYKVLKNKDKK